MKKTFPGTISDLGFLTAAAIELSRATSGREVTERRIEYGSHVFGIICAAADAVLRLHPESGYYSSVGGQQVWNPACLAALTRVLVEATANLHYFAVDEVGDEEREFRFLLADLHCQTERALMVKSVRAARHRARSASTAIRPASVGDPLDVVRDDIAALKAGITQNEFFQRLCKSCRRRWTEGIRPSFYDRKELFRRAGVSTSNADGEYRRLSSYVHTAPFAIDQIAAFRADDPSQRGLVDVTVRSCCGYLSLAITHYLRLFPDATAVLPTDAAELVKSCMPYATEMLDDDEGQA